MPPRHTQNFFDWIRSQGIYRGRDRWVGGVASGIAHRLGVDPLIIRGVLIVLTVFAGIGVLAYGIAWALLPEPDGRIHVQEAAAGRWTAGMTGALITSVIGFPSLGAGVWGWDRYGFGAFVWTVFWVGGAIYLVYYLTQRNKIRNGATPMTSRYESSSPSGAVTFAGTAGPAQQSGTPQHSATAQQPGTGQQSTAGFPQGGGRAYDQPGDDAAAYGADPMWGPPPPSGPIPPGPVPPGGYGPGFQTPPTPPAAPRSMGPGAPAVAITVGAALLVGGGIKALDAANVIDLGDAGNTVVWAIGAAILGLGILSAGLRGRTSGILGFFAVVALLIGGIFSVVPHGDRFRFHNADWTPASIEQARGGFEITGGAGTADLTKLALNPPLGSAVVVPIDATASNLTVVIPDTVPVQVRADMTMGNLHEGNQDHGGVTNQQTDYNTSKPGAPLVLQISGTVSNVTIKEGN
jgi:phage shock protein PspC (stress-responsive transcriptional regulator)